MADLKRITLLGDFESETSGQARFLFNLARGLAHSRYEISVVLAGPGGERMALLERAGIPVSSLGIRFDTIVGKFRRMTRANNAGRIVGQYVGRQAPSDWYIVLSDDLVSAVRYRVLGRWAYISNGDMALLFLNRAFVSAGRMSRSLISLGAADLLRTHSADASRYDLRLANSEFTRQLMSYLYGVVFQERLYPPVDQETFKPPSLHPKSNYVLAMARNGAEQNLRLLERLSKLLPLIVVGGAQIAGARCAGRVSDSVLSDLYGNAAFLAFPSVSEPFGYSFVEALACGTPSLVFDSAGPSELVRRTGCGWLVRTEETFLNKGQVLFDHGIEQAVRQQAVSAATQFSIETSAKSLISFLEAYSDRVVSGPTTDSDPKS